MNFFSRNCNNPLNKHEILDKSLDLHLQAKLCREWLKWGLINLLVSIVLMIDISNQCPCVCSNWFYIEYIIAGIFGINFLTYLIRYIFFILTFDPVRGTNEQKKLLKFDDADNSFVVDNDSSCLSKQMNRTDTDLLQDNATIISWHSSFNESINRRIGGSSPLWSHTYNRNTPSLHNITGNRIGLNTSWCSSSTSSSILQNTSLNRSNGTKSSFHKNTSSFGSPSCRRYLKDDIITDEKGLQKYLKEISKQEYSTDTEVTHPTAQTTFQHQQSMNQSFWSYYNTSPSLLKTSLYQLSPLSTPETGGITGGGIGMLSTGGSGIGGKIEIGDFEGTSEILKQISPAKLSQYVANLRVWISKTILQRLEVEINRIDELFRSRGFTDLQIGSVGLERLKKTAENQQFVSLHVPMLPLIVPYLEMSTNQEYLVQRIKDLAKGNCISDYRWNSGSSYHGLNWDEHLPTDSAILFHLFCTYLDNQLMPLPQPGGRSFFTRYVIIGDKKSPKDILSEVIAKNQAECAILCTNQLKPKFNFISNNKIHNCPYDRNNLFNVIIQFLIYMKNNHEGLLEGVNLGKSGINILCVIED